MGKHITSSDSEEVWTQDKTAEEGKKGFQCSSESEQHWTIDKTAELLNQAVGYQP